jgi:large subunit ribosomal protein L1
MVPGDDLPRVIEESKAGRIEYRVDKTSNIHSPIGKVSFSVDDLVDNLAAFMESLVLNRPAASKGQYVRKVVVASSMGPGVVINPTEASEMEYD